MCTLKTIKYHWKKVRKINGTAHVHRLEYNILKNDNSSKIDLIKQNPVKILAPPPKKTDKLTIKSIRKYKQPQRKDRLHHNQLGYLL